MTDALFDLAPQPVEPRPVTSAAPRQRPRPRSAQPPLDFAGRPCGYCRTTPATIVLGVAPNLLTDGYTDSRKADSYREVRGYAYCFGPSRFVCCDDCAHYLGSVYWGAVLACPTGACSLFRHTFDNPHPEWDCTRHHRELTVVWREPLAVV